MQDRIPGAKTVPQIIIDGNVIGGWDNLSAYAEPILTKLRTVYPA
jgi:glutaredoxin